MGTNRPASPSAVIQFIRTLYLSARLLFSPKVPMWPKLIPVAAVLYLLFPMDFLPDFIPGLGQVDDVTILLIALWSFVRLCPKDVIEKMQEEAGPATDGKVVDGSYRVVDDEPIDH